MKRMKKEKAQIQKVDNADDKISIIVEGHVVIRDKKTKKEIVNKRG